MNKKRNLQEMNDTSSPFSVQEPSKEESNILLQSPKPQLSSENHHDTLIEVFVEYKRSDKKEIINSSGLKETVEFGVYDIEISYAYIIDDFQKVKLSAEVYSNEEFSDHNKIYFGVSLDYTNNKGKIFYRPFDKLNHIIREKNLSVNTNGSLFINRGYQIILGDSHRHTSSITYFNQNGKEIQLHKGPHVSKKSKINKLLKFLI